MTCDLDFQTEAIFAVDGHFICEECARKIVRGDYVVRDLTKKGREYLEEQVRLMTH